MRNTNDQNSGGGPEPPAGDIPAGLTIQPEGVGVFTFTGRGSRLVTLVYRKRDTSRGAALEFPARVLSDLSAAGVSLRGKVKIEITPAPQGQKSARDPRFGCVVEVPIG